MESSKISRINSLVERLEHTLDELLEEGSVIEAVKKNCERIRASLRIIKLNIPVMDRDDNGHPLIKEKAPP